MREPVSRRALCRSALVSALIIAFFLTADTAFADSRSPFFYAARKETFSGVNFGRAFFVVPDCVLENCSGSVVVLFGKSTVEDGFYGDVYALFSEIHINGDAENMRARTFSSRVTFEENRAVNVSPVFPLAVRSGAGFSDDTIPGVIFAAIRAFLTICACFLILPLKKSFFEQCAAALMRERSNVLKAGLSSHAALTGIALLFLISAVGSPVALVVAVFAAAVCLVGEIGFGVALGYWVAKKLDVEGGIYTWFAIGAFIIETVTFLPYAGGAATFFVFPVIMEGVVFIGLFNKYIVKNLYNFHKN
jgi:hypothetical protein